MPLSRRYILFVFLLIPTACTNESLVALQPLELLPHPTTITLEITDYCPAKTKQLKDFIVSNFSAVIRKGVLQQDWDRDGIPDSEDSDAYLNIKSRTADTNTDGYSDLLMYWSGISAAQQAYLTNCLDPAKDSDGDGLNDCEEALLKTDRFKLTNDYLTKYLKIRNGINPLSEGTMEQDPDGDGISNYDEIKQHTPIYEYNTPAIQSLAYHYESSFSNDNGKLCFGFKVSNIPLTNVSNGNLVMGYIVEEDLATAQQSKRVFS
jgi:hypothetical protein